MPRGGGGGGGGLCRQLGGRRDWGQAHVRPRGRLWGLGGSSRRGPWGQSRGRRLGHREQRQVGGMAGWLLGGWRGCRLGCCRHVCRTWYPRQGLEPPGWARGSGTGHHCTRHVLRGCPDLGRPRRHAPRVLDRRLNRL